MLCAALNANAQENTYKFTHISVDEGLSHTDAKEVRQDGKGFIWIATLFGLDRYDGYRIKRFANNNDPSNVAFKNRIRSLYPDEDGMIWLSTEDGVQCFNSKTEKFIPLKQTPNSGATWGYHKIVKLKNNILVQLSVGKIKLLKINDSLLQIIPVHFQEGLQFFDFITDSLGNCWLASNNGIWVLKGDGSLLQCKMNINNNKNREQTISKISFNNEGFLLLAVGNDIIKTIQTSQEILREKLSEIYGEKKYHVASGQILDILQDQHKNCWVSTNEGLLRLDFKWDFLQVITNKSQNNGLTTNYLDRLYIDKSDCLWICTFGGGVNITDLNAKPFFSLQHNPELTNTLAGNHVRAIAENGMDNLWIGTNANGLCKYNFTTKKFLSIKAGSAITELRSNEINALVFDKNNKLWIGSSKGIQVLNKDQMVVETVVGAKDFPEHDVENLAVDFFGNIWFGSYSSGLGCIVNDNGQYTTKYYNIGSHSKGKSTDAINFIYADKDRPEIFVSTIYGLERLMISNDGSITRYFQYRINGKPNSLSSNYVWPVQRQNDSVIWVGTLGGGLNKVILKSDASYSATKYNSKDGFFNDVESLLIDDSGRIWMGGRGLECFNPITGELNEYHTKDGLQGNSFKVGASFKGESGRLYFGGINGLNYFYPADIRKNTINAAPLITEMIVNNRQVTVADTSENSISVKMIIPYTTEIYLNFRQTNFVVYFSSMHFANPEKCLYRYKLEGLDIDWKYTNGGNASAAYTNLGYKQYKLIVEATNNDDVWSGQYASLDIEIAPPWWKSTVANIIYLLLLAAFFYGIYIYLFRWYRLKRELAIREVEERRREEFHLQKEDAHQQQLQFFTNISHEFRTPLTLILGPLETLLKNQNQSPALHHLEGMHRNAKRMMNLISELMNFKKVTDKAILLQVTPIEIQSFVQSLGDEFNELALQREIDFKIVNNPGKLELWADGQVVEKILYNLLNNAFKYTSNGEKIRLEVFTDMSVNKPVYSNEFKLMNKIRSNEYLYFMVKDSGIGISKESIANIFERYYRVDDTHIGSGIGLALVKSLVELHKGDIYLYSERSIGTEIIVGIPLGKHNYSTEEIGIFTNNKRPKTVLEKITTISQLQFLTRHDNKLVPKRKIPNILIVEDNDELQSFLKESLQPFYEIMEASNGQIALDLIADKKPALIISDVMMPMMDGIQLCKHIKTTFETSHIPFILLTAKTNLNSQLEGVSTGADYYMSKPFSIDILLLTIQNIFFQQKKLKEMYANGFYEDATKLVQSVVDKKFMKELMDTIESNIENEELGVEFICRKLHTSRSKLYEKIKIISGQSIGDFIRSARLKKALDIMIHEDLMLQDVVERVGLKSTSYFTKAFKKEFGKAPAEYLRDLKQ
ncbi:two-component regulator propeller domain-containing protein [Ferruginibacter sp.]|uniref:hybrid sensor histidine kinase/response regulator transcription factor n=1 Tax=Ferruginibacter sp. TaxID=1940288 RepID=UPI00374D0C2A